MKGEVKMPEMVTPVEPDWLKRLVSITGMNVAIETTRKSLCGRLLEVEHDHIVLKIACGVIFIRNQQVISVMPLGRSY
ncbi:MAG: YuzF family protein [Pelosinus sp.]|nr:YuzF family protein [Pelosinus sp.]